VAAVAWLVTKTGWIGFIGFQSVMSVAYLPTIESLWRWKLGPSPEPMEKWGINVIIALIGVVVDITGRHDYLCAVTFKVKASFRWIQQLEMRASAFDESKSPDRMKVPAHFCA
jgi:hypothetical protein